MSSSPRIVVVDRSELAANLYRLLLAPLGAIFVIRRRLEEALPELVRRGAARLLIVNSNALRKSPSEVARHFEAAAPLQELPKIFLCAATDAEAPLRERVAAVAHATVADKPFHPEEFLTLVQRLLREAS